MSTVRQKINQIAKLSNLPKIVSLLLEECREKFFKYNDIIGARLM